MLYPALRVDGAQRPVALGKVSQPGGLFRQVLRELASAHGEVRTIVLIAAIGKKKCGSVTAGCAGHSSQRKRHLSNIFGKAGVSNRLELARFQSPRS
jgi:hypothetical protein